jgi:hypothetical protein
MEYMHICRGFDAGLAVYYGIMSLSLYQKDGVGGCFTWAWRCTGAINVNFWVFLYLDGRVAFGDICDMLIVARLTTVQLPNELVYPSMKAS